MSSLVHLLAHQRGPVLFAACGVETRLVDRGPGVTCRTCIEIAARGLAQEAERAEAARTGHVQGCASGRVWRADGEHSYCPCAYGSVRR